MKKSAVKKKPIKHLTIDETKLQDTNKKLSPIDQRLENIAKYGTKEDDTIARAYRKNKEAGDIYCAFNAEKYITRFNSDSKKGKNSMDLKKAIVYLERMIEMNEEKDEVIEK